MKHLLVLLMFSLMPALSPAGDLWTAKAPRHRCEPLQTIVRDYARWTVGYARFMDDYDNMDFTQRFPSVMAMNKSLLVLVNALRVQAGIYGADPVIGESQWLVTEVESGSKSPRFSVRQLRNALEDLKERMDGLVVEAGVRTQCPLPVPAPGL